MDDLAESLYYQIAEHTAGCPEGEIPVGEASCGCERDNIRKIADEIETLKARYRSLLDKHLALFTKRQRAEARVAELEAWHEESSETVANIALDYAQMKIERDTAEQRLRDVMIEACNRPLDVTVAIAKAAGYVRCKRCDGDGILMMEIGLSGGKRCDCINGWREANDV